MQPYPTQAPLFSSREKGFLWLLTLSVFIGVSNVMVIAPLLKWIQASTGLKESQFGMVLGAYPLFSLISGILMGPFSDRHGRRVLLILGLSGLSVCQILTGFSKSFETLILFRALSGIFGALISSSAYALVADYFHFHARPKAMGMVAGGTALAQIAGIPIGILVGGHFNWNMVFFVFAALTALLTAGVIFLLPAPKVALETGAITFQTYRRKYGLLFKNTNISLSLLTYFMMFAGVFVFAGAYPTWLDNVFSGQGVGFYQVALLFIIAGVGSFSGSSLSGFISARTHQKLRWVGLLNLLILVFIIAMPFFTEAFWIQYILYFGMMFVGGLRFPIFSHVVLHLASIAERGSMSAALSVMVQAASAAGAFLSGILLHLDPSFFLNVAGVILLFGAASALILLKLKEDPHTDHVSP